MRISLGALAAVLSATCAVLASSLITVEDYWREYAWNTCVPALMVGGDVDDRYEKPIEAISDNTLLRETWRPSKYPIRMTTSAVPSNVPERPDRLVECRIESIGTPVRLEDSEAYAWSPRGIALTFDREIQKLIDQGIAYERTTKSKESVLVERVREIVVCRSPSKQKAVRLYFDPGHRGDNVVLEATMIDRPYFGCRRLPE